MKIEKGKPEFTPIIITLESQQEIDIMWEIMYSVNAGGPAGGFADGIARDISGFVKSEAGDYIDLESYLAPIC